LQSINRRQGVKSPTFCKRDTPAYISRRMAAVDKTPGSLPLEEELKSLDTEIRRLKVQYDLYFAGNSPRPPTDQHNALGRAMRKLQGVEFRNMADRFLYNNVVNKFNTFQELWNKMMRAKEEGARVHPLALRAAKRAAQAESGGSAEPRAPAPAEPRAGGRTTPPAAAAAAARAWRVPTKGGDDAVVRRLYEGFMEARQASGDKRPLPYESFAREVGRQTTALHAKGDCESVEFKIYSHDNKVTLKVRPVASSRRS
jgi:hypothetical protein